MRKQTFFWIIAFLVTLSTAYYQRKTGPTKPVLYRIDISGEVIEANLPRSHGGDSDRELRITAENKEIVGALIYKRFKTDDLPDTIQMTRAGNDLFAFLPGQPP